uniref:BPTI/Kunitz inhibitor domain-containing protein n=1 Tax=Panagrolaimus sp. PS1159 TaxID=55785 RepID=A0AC35GZ93_9BILA
DRYAVSRIATCHTNKDCPHNYTCIQRNNRRACCPSTEYVCGTPFDTKNSCRRSGGDKQIGWTFNFKKGQCEKIDVAGCPDQLNDFATLEQCEDYCIGNCPDGSEPHINPFTGQPQMCSIKSNSGCPLGFECVRKSKFSAVCCKTSPTCPAPESLMYTSMGQGEAIRCVPGIESSCPDGYTCQEASNHEHICCTPALDCPFGMKALREDFNHPHVCTPGIEGNCPKDGYYCIRADLGPLQPLKNLCCKPEKKCVLPYVNEKTQRPQKCFPEIGNEEKEKAKTIGLIFYCCYDVDIFACPNGEMPLTTPDNKPQKCNLSDPKSCPVDYSCNTLLDDSFACCPVPDKQKLCKHPITKSDGNPISCGGKDDEQTCANQKGKCKRTIDMNYHCCRE